MKQALVVCRKSRLGLCQISQSFAALLLGWIPRVRPARPRYRCAAAALSWPDGIRCSSSRCILRKWATDTETGRSARSSPGFASHPSDPVAYTIRGNGAGQSLERSHSRVLQIGHVCHPEMAIHFLGKSRPQFELLDGPRLLSGKR